MEKDSSNQSPAFKEPKTMWNSVVGWIGFGVTSFVSDLVKDATYKAFGESTSSWVKGESTGFREGLRSGFLSFVDPKQWKSTAAMVAALLTGVLATEWLVDRIYNRPERKKLSAPRDVDALAENFGNAIKKVRAQQEAQHLRSSKLWAEAEQARDEAGQEISR